MTFNREFTADPQNRAATGDGFAEFMLGWAAAGNLGNENGENLMANTFAAFLQDDWKVSSRLTVNLGLALRHLLRADVPGRPRFQLPARLQPDGRRPAACRRSARKTAAIAAASRTCTNFGPRLGLAYRLTNKTVVRAGFGIIFAQDDSYSNQAARWINQSPDFVEYSLATVDRINPLATLQERLPGRAVARHIVPGPAAVGINVQEPSMPDQYSEQWFFDLQRELPYDILMTVGYSGNGARQLVVGLDYNLPYGPAASTVASRRIFPYYTGVTRQMPMGNSSYNALIWKVEKRFSKGLSFAFRLHLGTHHR